MERAFFLLGERDCEAAWNAVWPYAKSGETEARLWLAFFTHIWGLVPPGVGNDSLTRLRNQVILSVHGFPYSDNWFEKFSKGEMALSSGDDLARRGLKGLLGQDFLAKRGGRELVQCLDDGTDPKACISLAVESGFVPDFESFAREVDALASANLAPARCVVEWQLPIR
jgi:hypothetical protein